MKKSLPVIISIAGILLFSGAVNAGSLQITKDDTMHTMLTAQQGKLVTVKLDSGDELTGKVGEITDKLVVLQALTGKEFYDAVIRTDDIRAIIVRNKE